MSNGWEDFIKNNREGFHDLVPRSDLWIDIERRLPVPKEKIGKRTVSLMAVLRVAAMIIVVMGAFLAFYLHNNKPATNLIVANREYTKQRAHYASLIAAKRTELKSIAEYAPQLYNEFNTEIAQMDSIYRKLNHDLATSPNQELVLRAMIRNLQTQAEVLSQQLEVIEQYNELKQQKNESKGI
ncbi:MAG TPA: hypothetical protein VL442_11675 [Mucilaginibacter sp.]|jgi:hypothetical protein|nr:hypothetical protein [Mucilaginibacter sp.]